MQSARYHPVLVGLHWLLALLLLGALCFGAFVLGSVPNSAPEKLNLLRGHMLMGGLIFVLMVLRLVTRLVTRHPPAASTGNALLDRLAPWVHWGLYALVFAVLASGIGIAVLAHLPQVVFGGVGSLPDSFSNLPPRAAHGLLAMLLLLVVVLHAAAALYHQFMRRDGLLSRMTFGARR
jgi:cytochrome b561